MMPFSAVDQLAFLAQLQQQAKDPQLLRMILSLAESVKRGRRLHDYEEEARLRDEPATSGSGKKR